MGMRKLTIPLLAIFAACEGGANDEAAAEAAQMQASAARHACVGERLAQTAREDLALLEGTLVDAPAVAASVTAFARAFLQHAELRESVFALEDSALNHAATPADSIRYSQLVDRFELALPEEGSVEANVMADYDRKASEMLADTLHICYWRHEVGAD